ncbi:MAG: DNA-processing protein DprA [Wolinella sp.]
MIGKFSLIPEVFDQLKNPPKNLYYRGNIELLARPKVAILGTRNPNTYAKAITLEMARFFSQNGVVVVSGGAFGIDILAHEASHPETIFISPSSLDRPYPASHRLKFEKIASDGGLLLSEYESDFLPMRHTFLERNRLIVALGEIAIIPQADLKSGSMQSARIASELKKPLYVLPHRLRESLGTQELLRSGRASIFFDFEELFSRHFSQLKRETAGNLPHDSCGLDDEVLQFCAGLPSYDEAIARFGEVLLEYEFEGKVVVRNGRVGLV